MKDKVQEQQRRNEIMPKYAPDNPDPVDNSVSWEEASSQPILPRRSPWGTAGQDDYDLLAQVSDNGSEKALGQNFAFSNIQSSQPTRDIEVLSNVRVSGTNIVGDFVRYRLPATRVSSRTATLIRGAEC
jgi:hypothetical protein